MVYRSSVYLLGMEVSPNRVNLSLLHLTPFPSWDVNFSRTNNCLSASPNFCLSSYTGSFSSAIRSLCFTSLLFAFLKWSSSKANRFLNFTLLLFFSWNCHFSKAIRSLYFSFLLPSSNGSFFKAFWSLCFTSLLFPFFEFKFLAFDLISLLHSTAIYLLLIFFSQKWFDLSALLHFCLLEMEGSPKCFDLSF